MWLTTGRKGVALGAAVKFRERAMQSFTHLSLRQAGRAVEHSLTPMLDDLDVAANVGRPVDVQDTLQRYAAIDASPLPGGTASQD